VAADVLHREPNVAEIVRLVDDRRHAEFAQPLEQLRTWISRVYAPGQSWLQAECCFKSKRWS
jgi:hypothetical protein